MKSKNFTEEDPNEQVRVVDHVTGEPIADLAYFIEAPDGTVYTGSTDADGLCERIATYEPADLTVWLGDDAEAKKGVA